MHSYKQILIKKNEEDELFTHRETSELSIMQLQSQQSLIMDAEQFFTEQANIRKKFMASPLPYYSGIRTRSCSAKRSPRSKGVRVSAPRFADSSRRIR